MLIALIAGLLGGFLTGCGKQSGADSPAPTTTAPASVTLSTARGPVGVYLTDGAGRAVYLWDADREGSSTCYGDCAKAWPPVTVTGQGIAGPGAQAGLIGTERRTDGSRQLTYNGWPLYYFAADTGPGQLSGQADTGFGAVWWLLTPAGQPLTSEPVTSAAASSSQ